MVGVLQTRRFSVLTRLLLPDIKLDLPLSWDVYMFAVMNVEIDLTHVVGVFFV